MIYISSDFWEETDEKNACEDVNAIRLIWTWLTRLEIYCLTWSPVGLCQKIFGSRSQQCLVSEILDSVKLVSFSISISWHFHSLGQNLEDILVCSYVVLLLPASCTMHNHFAGSQQCTTRATSRMDVASASGSLWVQKEHQSKQTCFVSCTFFLSIITFYLHCWGWACFQSFVACFFPIILLEMILLLWFWPLCNSKGLFGHVGIPPMLYKSKPQSFTAQNEAEALWDLGILLFTVTVARRIRRLFGMDLEVNLHLSLQSGKGAYQDLLYSNLNQKWNWSPSKIAHKSCHTSSFSSVRPCKLTRTFKVNMIWTGWFFPKNMAI